MTASSSPRPSTRSRSSRRYCTPKLRKRQVDDGTVLSVRHGSVVRRERFTPPAYTEDDPLPEPRGLRERESCLRRLATIAAAL